MKEKAREDKMRKEKIRGQFGDLFAMYLLNTGLNFDRGQGGGGGQSGWGDAEVDLGQYLIYV